MGHAAPRQRVGVVIATLLSIGAVSTSSVARPAHADIVVVNGRKLVGEIVEETSDKVVLRQGTGTITLARRAITSVERQDLVATLLLEARVLARNRDSSAVEVLARVAALLRERGDTEGARRVEADGAALAKRLGRAAAAPAAPAAPAHPPTRPDRPGALRAPETPALAFGDDPFLLEADFAAVASVARSSDMRARQLAAVQLVAKGDAHLAAAEPRWAIGCFVCARKLDRTRDDSGRERMARYNACRDAIRAGDLPLARAAIRPLEGQTDHPDAAYLNGRVYELEGADDDAARIYRSILPDTLSDLATRPADILGHFVREMLRGRSPEKAQGYGSGWSRVASEHLAVYHGLGEKGPTSADLEAYEEVRKQTLSRLGMDESQVAFLGRTLIFMYASREDYAEEAEDNWSVAHARPEMFDDGPHATISTSPSRAILSIGHELAHVFTFAVHGRLLPWLEEGSATYAGAARSRQYRSRLLSRAFASEKSMSPLREFLALPRIDEESNEAIRLFYARAYGVFAAIAKAAGSGKAALALGARMQREGIDAALAEVGLTVDTLDKKIHEGSSSDE